MSTDIPQVRIKFGWLLSGVTSATMNDKFGDGTPFLDDDEYSAIAEKYEKWWRPFNDTILKGMCDVLDLRFRQKIIDVYVSPWFTPISDPMVVGPAFRSQDDLVNTLTHEMIHRLLTDNTTYDYSFDYIPEWKEMFGEHSWNTLVHIPVHAVMQAVYIDVLDRPDLLEFDIKQVSEYEEYKHAWNYVKKVGYKSVIEKLVNSEHRITIECARGTVND